MNETHNKRLVVSFVIWEPYSKITLDEIDVLINKLKTKELLGHAGYVKLELLDGE